MISLGKNRTASKKERSGGGILQPVMDEAGVSSALFSEVFLPAFEGVSEFGAWGKSERQRVATFLRQILARRRGAILPVGVAEEDIHRCKDRWTYVVYLAALLHQGQVVAREKTEGHGNALVIMLPSLLPTKGWDWIRSDIEALETLVGSATIYGSASSAQAMARLIKPMEEPSRTNQKEVNAQEAQQQVEKSNEGQARLDAVPSKRALGEEFLRWVVECEACHWLEFEEGGIAAIETPRAFMEFGRKYARSWKAVQSGVQKLRLHQLSEEGNPFLTKNGKTIMRLSVADYCERRSA